MARKPRPGKDDAAPGQPAGGGIVSSHKADTSHSPAPSQIGEDAVHRLARLVGRQIARERYRGKEGSRTGSRPKGKKA